jgi:hypothetical protein
MIEIIHVSLAVFGLMITVAFTYMFPAIIAYARGSKQFWKIAVVNLVLGMTIIGWIVTFIWALCDTTCEI